MESETEKVTIRVPAHFLRSIDFLVAAGDFPSRSEAIRAALRDMVYERVGLVSDKLEKIREAQEKMKQAEAHLEYLKR